MHLNLLEYTNGGNKCGNKKAQQPYDYWASSDPVWIRTKDLLLRRQLLYPAELRDPMPIKKGDDRSSPLSGRQDSNLRPPGPKPGAMTGLRYAPNDSSSISIVKLNVFSFFFFQRKPLLCLHR